MLYKATIMMSQNDPGSITKVSRLNTLILHLKVKILQLKENSHAQMPLPCIFAIKSRC